jgi:ferritin-like metal-binding protein YciE
VRPSGVCDTQHHEIAVYEGLITKAEATGEQDIVALLQENLAIHLGQGLELISKRPHEDDDHP